MKLKATLFIFPLFLVFFSFLSVNASSYTYSWNLTELPQPISGEHVMAILETEDYVLVKTDKGIRRSTDWENWEYVLNLTSDIQPWYVFDRLPNGWIYASFNDPIKHYVSKDNGTTWTEIITNIWYGSFNAITQLPNGTILATPHSKNDGGIIWATDDGLNWHIWKNLTEIGRNIGWLNSTERHRHAHHVFYVEGFGLFAVGGEGINTTVLPKNKKTVYYDDSSPYGDTWKAMGEGIATVDYVVLPNGILLFPDYDVVEDIKYWNGENLINLNVLTFYSPHFSPAIFRTVYKQNLNAIIIGCCLRDTYRQGGIILLTDDLKQHYIIENVKSLNGIYKEYYVFDGLGNNVYIVKKEYNATSGETQEVSLFKLTINKTLESSSSQDVTSTITEMVRQLTVAFLTLILVIACVEMVSKHVV